MNLRELANKFEAFDGQVALYYLPYQSLKCDVAISALEAITPQFRWVNTRTGDVTHTEPREWTAAQDLARQLKRPVENEWTRERQWNLVHDVFAVVLPSIVDTEFNLAENAPAELRALRLYFQSQNGSAEANWTLYNDLIGAKALSELWHGYLETRDKTFNAPEIETADPEVDGGTAAG